MGLKRHFIFAKTQRQKMPVNSLRLETMQCPLYYIFILNKEMEIWPLVPCRFERERKKSV